MKTAKAKKKKFDREIMKWVQAVEKDIPADLEKTFLAKLKEEEMTPAKTGRKRYTVYYAALATAASLLLALLLFLFYPFHRQDKNSGAETRRVWVQEARVEGEPASTFIFEQKDPDITIVWVEKIKK